MKLLLEQMEYSKLLANQTSINTNKKQFENKDQSICRESG